MSTAGIWETATVVADGATAAVGAVAAAMVGAVAADAGNAHVPFSMQLPRMMKPSVQMERMAVQKPTQNAVLEGMRSKTDLDSIGEICK